MKRIFRHTATTALLFCCIPSFAANTHMIYGLQTAEHFHARTTGEYYIQAGSFLSQAKAEHHLTELHAKTAYPVKMIHKGKYNHVVIGPIRSAPEVRKVADEARKTLLMSSHENIQHLNQTDVQYKSTISPVSHYSRSHWFASLGGGMEHPSFDATMRINNGSDFPVPFSNDIYSTKNKNEPVFVLSAGRRFELENQWLSAYSLGLMYQNVFATNAGRTIMQYSSTDFINYKYRDHMSSNVFLAFAKLNLVHYRFVSPYIKLGAGLALNRSSDYAEKALPNVTQRVSPAFSSDTTSQFAYDAGLGIDVDLMPQVSASLSYDYLNLGHVNSGQGRGDWSTQSLNSTSYRVNEIVLSFTYLFDK
jgi:opacity protein-like surface antigen